MTSRYELLALVLMFGINALHFKLRHGAPTFVVGLAIGVLGYGIFWCGKRHVKGGAS